VIADRNFPQFLVGLHVLNIGFDEGMEVPHLCYECMLTLDNTIEYLICRRSRAGVIGVLFRLFLVLHFQLADRSHPQAVPGALFSRARRSPAA
jgi:hypothetical protein